MSQLQLCLVPVRRWCDRWRRAQRITVDRQPATWRGRCRRWALRRIIGHEGETCHICGSRYSSLIWWADSALWNRVTLGRYGLLCPRCFTRLGDRQGEMVCWLALPLALWDEAVSADGKAAIVSWRAQRLEEPINLGGIT